VRTIDEICEKIDETIALGGTGVLMQGGLHPDFGVEWYEDLLRTLSAKYPGFQLHCFSPPEIHNLHLISGLDYVTIMQRLKDAGLYSLPGAAQRFSTMKCGSAWRRNAPRMNGSR
jgi:cyclic dehypoxanthinyl futalosine synthase